MYYAYFTMINKTYERHIIIIEQRNNITNFTSDLDK